MPCLGDECIIQSKRKQLKRGYRHDPGDACPDAPRPARGNACLGLDGHVDIPVICCFAPANLLPGPAFLHSAIAHRSNPPAWAFPGPSNVRLEESGCCWLPAGP